VMTVNATVADVMKQVRERTVLVVGVAGDVDGAAKTLGSDPAVDSIDIKDGKLLVTLHKEVSDYSELPTRLLQAGHKLTLFREEEVNLESAFMALTKGTGAKI
jgi:ABC-2 type transport system ATP-binding protein